MSDPGLSLQWVVVLLACAAGLAYSLGGRERRASGAGVAIAITGTRLVLIAVVVTLLANPSWQRERRRVEHSTLAVMLDASASFGLTDPQQSSAAVRGEAAVLEYLPTEKLAASEHDIDESSRVVLERVRRSTRLERARRLFTTRWWQDLVRDFDVEFYALADHVTPLPGDNAAEQQAAMDSLRAAGGTHLGSPLAAELMRLADRRRLAGVLLVTDGRHHSPDDLAAAFERIAALNAPVAAIGVGPIDPPRDVDLLRIDADRRLLVGESVKAHVTLRVNGFDAGTPLDVIVRREDETIFEQRLTVPDGGGTMGVSVAFDPGAAGRKKFVVSVPAEPGEITADNNTRELWVDVVEGPARVLYLEGRPRWDWRYLRARWQRDERFDAETLLLAAAPNDVLPPEFPTTREGLFEHTLLILGDVSPDVMSRELKRLLNDFVTERGGTLMLLAGPQHMPYAWLATPLADLLPIRPVDPLPSTQLGFVTAREGLSLELTPAGERSPITRLLTDRERNVELWELLPAHLWLSPVDGVVEGAEVLASVAVRDVKKLRGFDSFAAGVRNRAARAREFVHSRGAVLVTRDIGAGRVIYLGIDSTWRWRYRIGDRLHTRFWEQLVRFAVLSELSEEDDALRLGASETIYESNEDITIETVLKDDVTAANVDRITALLTASTVDAATTSAAGAPRLRVTLAPVERGGHRYRGRVSAQRLLESVGNGEPARVNGDEKNTLAAREFHAAIDPATVPGYDAAKERATVSFVVVPEDDPESSDLSCNATLLKELATLTDGVFLPLSRADECGELWHRDSRVAAHTETMTAWDSPLLLLSLVLGILLVEWLIRSRAHLP